MTKLLSDRQAEAIADRIMPIDPRYIASEYRRDDVRLAIDDEIVDAPDNFGEGKVITPERAKELRDALAAIPDISSNPDLAAAELAMANPKLKGKQSLKAFAAEIAAVLGATNAALSMDKQIAKAGRWFHPPVNAPFGMSGGEAAEIAAIDADPIEVDNWVEKMATRNSRQAPGMIALLKSMTPEQRKRFDAVQKKGAKRSANDESAWIDFWLACMEKSHGNIP